MYSKVSDMKNRYSLFTVTITCLILGSTDGNAATVTWVAQSPNNDLNDSANWSPNTVPGIGDDATFNSDIPGIDTNPFANTAPFSVSTFNFLNFASVFHFNFNNTPLSFYGAGIVGFHTNPFINMNNINNSSFPGDLLSFLGVSGTSGSSNITLSNSATLTGNYSGMGLGSINSFLHSTGSFSISQGGVIAAANEGIDNTSGTGNNSIGSTGSSQLRFDQSFTAADDVTVSVSNSGTFSGINSIQGDAVAVIGGSQLISSGIFQVGDNFSCNIQNTGNDNCVGIGLSNIGQINAAQMLLQSTAIVGDNCSIALSNTGINSSQTASFIDFVGYLNDQQFCAAGTFQAGDDFSLKVSNTGIDTSSGNGGSQVGVLNSNSGTTGMQVLFNQGCILGDDATISAANFGCYSGSNINGGSNVGSMNLQQIVFGDSLSPGSYAFNAGDAFSLTACNTGIDNSTGKGANAVGNVSTDQITFYTPCFLEDNATITLSNSGTFGGNASTLFVTVGSVGSSQLNCQSNFQTGDNFTLNVSNSGTHSGSGAGSDFIGNLITGQQVHFNNGLVIGNDARITILNNALNSSSTTTLNQVGSLFGYGKQLLVSEKPFQAGDNLQLTISNFGFDNSEGAGGNYVGFMNNNTVDHTASQLHLADGGSVGDFASMMVLNTGFYKASNATGGGSLISVLAGQQFNSVNDFNAGSHFHLIASNSGADNASGQNNHMIGSVGGGPQVLFGNACLLGDNANILLNNSGINNDEAGAGNTIGFVNGSQLQVNGVFSAGTNLNLTARNEGRNAGDDSNIVGSVNGSQLLFSQECMLDSSSIISAVNSGTVSDSQIVFNQGFSVASGKVTIQALNTGTVGAFGIDIKGSNAGGNAEVHLGNSSLYIETTLPTFTIAGLNGDGTSYVKSQPTLIINTDASTLGVFSGSIQNFPAAVSSLVKTGPGEQKLSGVNTYTGLTTIQEGTLVVNGSLAGDLLVNPFGTLKGTGTIAGMTTNRGVIAPGESIGTLQILNNFSNLGGNYALEVNGAGSSDLIQVSGEASLDGGNVIVSSIDGLYQFGRPYTIMTAALVNGTYSEASVSAFLTPILTYDPARVYLTLLPNISPAARTHNQSAVAHQLDTLTTPNLQQSLVLSNIVNLPEDEVQQVLESYSGYQYTDDAWSAEITNRQFIRRLYDPLRTLVTTLSCQKCGWSTWLETGGGATRLHGNKEAHGFHMHSYELTGGCQFTGCSSTTLGAAGSYTNDSIHYTHGGSGRRNAGFAGIYGLYRPNGFYLLADATYGYHSGSLERRLYTGLLKNKAQGKPKITQATFYEEIGCDLSFCSIILQPFAGIQLGKSWRSPIKERNCDVLSLALKKHEWTQKSTRLGVHLTADNMCQWVNASLDVAWNRLLSGQKNSMHARFIDFGNSFTIRGIPFDANSVDYALTLSTPVCECFKAYVEVGGETWKHAVTYDALAGVNFSW